MEREELRELEGPAEVSHCFPSEVKVQFKWGLSLHFFFPWFATSSEIDTCHIIHPPKVYNYDSFNHRVVQVAAQPVWEHFHD